MKNTLLIIGSFPSKKLFVHGGITQDCLAIINSERFEKYEILRFSTAISNPPPKLPLRTLFAF